jgi:hypothetical protein
MLRGMDSPYRESEGAERLDPLIHKSEIEDLWKVQILQVCLAILALVVGGIALVDLTAWKSLVQKTVDVTVANTRDIGSLWTMKADQTPRALLADSYEICKASCEGKHGIAHYTAPVTGVAYECECRDDPRPASSIPASLGDPMGDVTYVWGDNEERRYRGGANDSCILACGRVFDAARGLPPDEQHRLMTYCEACADRCVVNKSPSMSPSFPSTGTLKFTTTGSGGGGP